ncbi:MAG: Mor transcription activator family protein [Sodalis sp. (in: enterobacteria)]|uniref:Mor transcription activator family protein n=1 Tax=Sodalis sp. (in: enterobacteria) TaxID=1898979 RepID=UPI0039E7137E
MGAAKHNELLDYLAESVQVVLTGKTDIPQKCVRRAAGLVKSWMTFVWANSVIYVPKQLHSQNLSRNQKIFTDFDGYNHPALSEKYGLSIQRIYAIVK